MTTSSPAPEADVLRGPTLVAARLRELDWTSHPLGAPDQWPAELRTALRMILGSAQPIFLLWGPQRSFLYNDAFIPQLGSRHPSALGAEWLSVWPERRERLEGLLGRLDRGEPVGYSTYEVTVDRVGSSQTATFGFAFAPIENASGEVGGFACFTSELTAQLVAERNLELVERKLRREAERVDLAHASGAIMGTWDWHIPSDRFRADARFAKSFGLDPDDCDRGLPLEKVVVSVHPADQQGLDAAIGAAIAEGEDYVHRYRVKRADGRYYWVEAIGKVERDANGAPVRFPGVLLNLEERRAQDLALRASEARFQAIANSIDQMIWVTRPDGYHEYYNDRWYEFTGMPIGSTDGEEWNGMFHPDDQERAWATWRHSLATGEPYHIEYRLRHRSGEYRWVIGRAQCQRDEMGDIAHWYGTCTDIHDLRMAEQELHRTSSLLRLIGESTPDLIYAKDRDGRLLYANRAVERALGRSDVIGLNAYDYAQNRAEADAIIANEREVMESGETLERDELLTSPDGLKRYFRTTKAPLRGPDGTTIGIAAVTIDVTKRRVAEEREQLLVREVDHRAKNLLGVVQSVVQLTRADNMAAFKDAVTGRIQSLSRAHSLLAAERWDGVHLRALMNEELSGFDRAGSRVSIHGPPLRLRPAASQALALCVHELATNAVKYGALSSEGGTLDVDWSMVGGEQPMLRFHWLERGGPLTKAPERRGFGSTVIRSSIERQLGGTLDLDWRPEGLAAQFDIPADQLAESAEAPTGVDDEVLELTDVETTGTGQRILIVEDEALIALQIEQVVRHLGFEIVGPAGSVAQGLELLEAGSIDAAVIDVSLGRERSDPLADELARRGVPYIVCTGYAEPAGRSVAAAVDTLGKPLETAALKRALQRAIGKRR